MLAVSPQWASALATDHGLAVKINVLYDGATLAEDIDFIDGSVKVDRGSDVRRSLSLSIADPALFPVNPTDELAVYGQQIYVERGFTYVDGSTELLPQGTFVITSVSGNIHTGPLSIEASGMEILLKRALWDSAQSTTGYATAATFLGFHIPDTIPGASFVDQSTGGAGALATKTWDVSTDKWSAMTEVAAAVGAELFCNANGTFILADIPDPDDLSVAPAWDVTTGESGVMVSATMQLSADGVYNRVVVTGENTADNVPPVSGEARITDLGDPLRYGGPFGKVTQAYSSSLVTSTGQANATAAAMLLDSRAPNRTVSLQTVPNPALDAGDRIRVDYGPAALPEIHIVQSFSVPLSASDGAFSIETVSGKAAT